MTTATTTNERTPLISRPDHAHGDESGSKSSYLGSWARRIFSVEHRILLAGFLITLSFSFTQVPYVASLPILIST